MFISILDCVKAISTSPLTYLIISMIYVEAEYKGVYYRFGYGKRRNKKDSNPSEDE